MTVVQKDSSYISTYFKKLVKIQKEMENIQFKVHFWQTYKEERLVCCMKKLEDFGN